MRATSTVVVLAGLIGSLVASDGYSQAPSCSLGGTCLSVIPTCRFDSPSNPLPPPPPTILNVSVVPSNPTVERLNSAVARWGGSPPLSNSAVNPDAPSARQLPWTLGCPVDGTRNDAKTVSKSRYSKSFVRKLPGPHDLPSILPILIVAAGLLLAPLD